MTTYLSSYLPAINSLLPRSSPPTAPLPAIGDPAPSPLGHLDLTQRSTGPTLVAFVRHCGCPFAEKEVRLLAEQASKYEKDGLRVVIVQHSDEEKTREWFKAVGGETLFPANSYVLVADPQRDLYAQWGIGILGWTQMINSNALSSLRKLKASDGIDLRPTSEGSWRWQNSGGFALDKQGKIRWSKVASDSSDVCDYAEAAGSVVVPA